MKITFFSSLWLLGFLVLVNSSLAQESLTAGKLTRLADGFKFTEGPAWDGMSTLYFSDIPNKKIHTWSQEKGASVYKELEGASNGLFFDANGNLLVCQPPGRQVLQISPSGEETVLVSEYRGKKVNSPNDLWITPEGGVFFTDPRYGSQEGLEQGGFHVYYLSRDRRKLKRVVDNLVKPNGVVGTSDGKTLFIADHGAEKTYRYDIGKNGALKNRRLAAPAGSDGLTVDERGNLYLTGDHVTIYNDKAELIETIEIPERPANLTFGGEDYQTLFITARSGLYAVPMKIKGDPVLFKNE
ncbi:Glutathione peroxidase [Planctomycetales bacterium 10988]|nr:Glutathione peroxidase [Planctomycetales bacterium 10988]